MTFHSLRRTYANLLAEGGARYGYTKSQLDHKSAKLTMEVYTDADNRLGSANERIGTLLRTPEWAQTGTNPPDAARNGSDRWDAGQSENAEVAEETT